MQIPNLLISHLRKKTKRKPAEVQQKLRNLNLLNITKTKKKKIQRPAEVQRKSKSPKAGGGTQKKVNFQVP